MIENPKSKDPLIDFFLPSRCLVLLRQNVRFANKTTVKILSYGHWGRRGKWYEENIPHNDYGWRERRRSSILSFGSCAGPFSFYHFLTPFLYFAS